MFWNNVKIALRNLKKNKGFAAINITGLAIGLTGLGCGIGQGLTAGNTTAGIARNPGAAGSMFTNFILAMVLIESIAIYGLVVALLEVRVIFDFVLFAWSGIACAFTPVVLCSLFWKGTTREGAIAGMIGGFATTVIWVRVFKADFYDLYEMIPGFFVGLVICIAVSLVTKPDDDAVAELESVRETVGPVF